VDPKVARVGADPGLLPQLAYGRFPLALARLETTPDGDPEGVVLGAGLDALQQQHLTRDSQ